MLSSMAKEMAKEEHLRQQQGKESSKAVRCKEGRAVETGSFKEAEVAKGELRSSISQGADEIKETELLSKAEAEAERQKQQRQCQGKAVIRFQVGHYLYIYKQSL